MSIYEKMRKENSRSFRVKVEANIDLCSSCVFKNARSPEHFDPCSVNLDKRDIK